ncbi:putative cell wall protein [Quercus robur]|uniref:putative cell wall protein n=1 Tax=Quercus robur TaxID=38942 RepID=UPI002161A45C|nr:putative cell wall protein [Quercus robur]
MAKKTSSVLLAQLFIVIILLAIAGQAFAGRHVSNSKNVDMKQPEWLISDGSVLIPGIGRVTLPPFYKQLPFDPYITPIGNSGNNIPGVEAPNPGPGGSPAPNHL